ncbi:MAG: hypothetical protein CL916_06535 [Deltaproteobacteria bacterium]|nr:hypothetical protein [Deltaproteobacteria bacterium]
MILMFFSACSLSATDAQTVFLSLYQPILDISDQCVANSTYDSDVEENATLGSNWEGSITAQGTRADYEDIAHFTLSVDVHDVYVMTGDLSFNGTIGLYMEYAIDPTDNTSTSQSMTLSESLTITGDVSGTAKLNLTIVETYNAQSEITSTQASGDLSGTDVSSFLQGTTP